MKKKTIALLMAVVIVIGAAVGGTIAYLTDRTDTVVNTFTVGNIDIDLAETTGDEYKMVPGTELPKNPKVTVEAGSEACWLFVKVEESQNLGTYIDYDMAPGWLQLKDSSGNDVKGVFYREASAEESFDVIGYTKEDSSFVANKVLVKDTVTKADMEALKAEGATQPTLTFTAYAVQRPGFDTAAAAWAEANQ